MDELTAKLAGSFDITSQPNNVSAPHPRYAQFKQKYSKSDQDSRRKDLLQIQKSHRFDYMNHVRRLTDNDWKEEEEGEQLENNKKNDEEGMEVETRLHKPGRYYKDQLMLSEWLVEVPHDFSEEWISVLCPVAKRCLIVASKGRTRAFTKSGYCLNTFPSHLPGGRHHKGSRSTTILDCLYSELEQTYYILDLMCWNNHPVYESETDFRFFWLHEKLQEFSNLGEKCKLNPFKFVALPSFRCVQEDIATAVDTARFEIDGLLFFHKRTHYTFGSTPLVVWLKPYMLQEILGISVPISQMSHMPEDYTTYADHMKKVEDDKVKAQKAKEERLKQGYSPRGRGGGASHGRGRGRGRRCKMEISPDDVSQEDPQQPIQVEEQLESPEVEITNQQTDSTEADCSSVEIVEEKDSAVEMEGFNIDS